MNQTNAFIGAGYSSVGANANTAKCTLKYPVQKYLQRQLKQRELPHTVRESMGSGISTATTMLRFAMSP